MAHTCGWFHCSRGENEPQNCIYEYPTNKKLINKGHDTYDIQSFGCEHYQLCENQTSNVGIIRYECLGHPEPNPHPERRLHH